MVTHQIVRYIRPYAEARENMLDRIRRGTFESVDLETATPVFDSLSSLDRDSWAAAFMEIARPFEERARELEVRGETDAARQNYLSAYGWYRLGRYPAPNSPGKKACYERCLANYLSAARWFN